MKTTMLCIWWLLFLSSIGGIGWFGWKSWKTGRQTEGYDMFGYGVLSIFCFVFGLLSAATICVIKLSC